MNLVLEKGSRRVPGTRAALARWKALAAEAFASQTADNIKEPAKEPAFQY